MLSSNHHNRQRKNAIPQDILASSEQSNHTNENNIKMTSDQYRRCHWFRDPCPNPCADEQYFCEDHRCTWPKCGFSRTPMAMEGTEVLGGLGLYRGLDRMRWIWHQPKGFCGLHQCPVGGCWCSRMLKTTWTMAMPDANRETPRAAEGSLLGPRRLRTSAQTRQQVASMFPPNFPPPDVEGIRAEASWFARTHLTAHCNRHQGKGDGNCDNIAKVGEEFCSRHAQEHARTPPIKRPRKSNRHGRSRRC